MMQFGQSIMITMAVADTIVKKSSKEYKKQEAERRSNMSDMEKHREDMAKFNLRRG